MGQPADTTYKNQIKISPFRIVDLFNLGNGCETATGHDELLRVTKNVQGGSSWNCLFYFLVQKKEDFNAFSILPAKKNNLKKLFFLL
jgi:hypothetical protein